MKKPALDEKVERVALMRKQLVRVLDDDGSAVGEWVPDLSADAKIAGLRDMMTVRSFDARMLRAHRQGKISFYMQALGEEAIACAQQRALRPGDMHFPTYRQQGLLIAAGYPIVQMMNQILSNEQDPLKGRQLPVLYSADLEATLDAVVEAGGTIVRPIFAFPGGRRFHFTDPAGNELAVWAER